MPAYSEAAKTVKALDVTAGKCAARTVQCRQGSRPGTGRSGLKRMYSRFVALRIRPVGREIRKAAVGAELPVRRPPAEWPADEDEPVLFWLSNLPKDTPLAILVSVAHSFCTLQQLMRSPKETVSA